jgi:hypothetical protein
VHQSFAVGVTAHDPMGIVDPITARVGGIWEIDGLKLIAHEQISVEGSGYGAEVSSDINCIVDSICRS